MDNSWMPGFMSGVGQKLTADFIKWAAPLVGSPMIAWFKSKRWTWAKIVLDTALGWVCFYVLFNGFTTGPLLSFQWWQYLIGAVALGVSLILDWRNGRKTPAESLSPAPRKWLGFWV